MPVSASMGRAGPGGARAPLSPGPDRDSRARPAGVSCPLGVCDHVKQPWDSPRSTWFWVTHGQWLQGQPQCG